MVDGSKEFVSFRGMVSPPGEASSSDRLAWGPPVSDFSVSGRSPSASDTIDGSSSMTVTCPGSSSSSCRAMSFCSCCSAAKSLASTPFSPVYSSIRFLLDCTYSMSSVRL